MNARTTSLLAAAALSIVGVAACGGPASPAPPRASSPAATESNPPGDIPDNQAFVEFSPPGGSLSVKVPEGWAQTSSAAATVFTDKLNRIEIQVSKSPVEPTTGSVTSTDVAKLQASVPKFAQPKVTGTARAVGPVVLLTYQGDSQVDPVTGEVVRDAFERYTAYRNGTRIDLTLAGPVNADNVDPWRIVSDSLRWTR